MGACTSKGGFKSFFRPSKPFAALDEKRDYSMTANPTNIIYHGDLRQVLWRGIGIENGSHFDFFMKNEVSSRLYDDKGTKDFMRHLQGLATTEFGHENLMKMLEAEIPEERDWAIGEAIAEAYLERHHNIIWPWNMERDKRTPKASLPGADLIGFQVDGEIALLALGEVKTSAEERAPPNVMYGRSGVTHQIDKLANNLGLICQLLKWLWPRCKGTEYEHLFNETTKTFLNSGNKAVSLFGVLIRDTTPNPLDLKSRGESLSETLHDPTTCHLLALYLPCAIADLPNCVNGCES